MSVVSNWNKTQTVKFEMGTQRGACMRRSSGGIVFYEGTSTVQSTLDWLKRKPNRQDEEIPTFSELARITVFCGNESASFLEFTQVLLPELLDNLIQEADPRDIVKWKNNDGF